MYVHFIGSGSTKAMGRNTVLFFILLFAKLE